MQNAAPPADSPLLWVWTALCSLPHPAGQEMARLMLPLPAALPELLTAAVVIELGLKAPRCGTLWLCLVENS